MTMIMKQLVCFTIVMLIEGASVKVHPGGNVTLSCTIKNDIEISWIITNGNQTFVRIMKLENLFGSKVTLGPSFTHPDYEGRIRADNSSTYNHSLLLLNITRADLMLYCCMDCHLEHTYCTKLDFEEQQDAAVSHELVIISTSLLSVVCVFLLLVSSVGVCWRGTELQRGCGRTNDLHSDCVHISVQGKTELTQDDWTLTDVLYTPIL